MTKRFIFILHEMGTLDHAIALKSQILEGGGFVNHVILEGNRLPHWVGEYFLNVDQLSEGEALRSLDTFHAAWLQEPYEELRPIKWRRIWEKVPVVYSGYGIPLANWKKGLYEFPFYDNCKLILASGPLDESEHLTAGRGLRDVVVTGDPLMFEAAKLQKKSSLSSVFERVLWAPHWTQTWVDGSRGFATWEWVVRSLYGFFKCHPNVQLIVRPHPHLNFRDGNFASRLIARKLFSLPNVSHSESSMLSDISMADVLLSDGVSILAYFGLTGKPVVVVQNEGHPPPFSELGKEIVAQMKTVRNLNELRALLTSLSSGNTDLLPDINSVTDIISRHFLVAGVSPGRFLVDNI